MIFVKTLFIICSQVAVKSEMCIYYTRAGTYVKIRWTLLDDWGCTDKCTRAPKWQLQGTRLNKQDSWTKRKTDSPTAYTCDAYRSPAIADDYHYHSWGRGSQWAVTLLMMTFYYRIRSYVWFIFVQISLPGLRLLPWDQKLKKLFAQLQCCCSKFYKKFRQQEFCSFWWSVAILSELGELGAVSYLTHWHIQPCYYWLYGIKLYGVGVIASDVTFIPGLVAIVVPVLKLKKMDTQITQCLTRLLSSLKETGILCVSPIWTFKPGDKFFQNLLRILYHWVLLEPHIL